MSAADWWLGAIGTLVAAETVALSTGRTDATLSFATRLKLHTDEPAGRVAFVAGWTLLSVWFVPHILKSASSINPT